jgi:hypothetical protein
MDEQPHGLGLPFSRMNETDIRAEVLEPLLRRLGYSMTGTAAIRREHSLSYPYLYLGRKKPGKDLMLRGVADYTLEVAGHARWTLEAKPPSDLLDDEVIQQAWSYAIHPEVQSSYFAICNGRNFKLYSTSSAWSAGPLLDLTYDELHSRFSEVQAYLGPSEIARHHPNHLLSAGKPLAPGQRAFARIASGTISYHRSSLPIPMLSQMQVSIVDGTIRRDSAGRIQAQLRTSGPFRAVQEEIDRLGLSFQIYETSDECLSLSPAEPTVFKYVADQFFPFMMDPTTFTPRRLDTPMRVQIQACAIGHLDADVFGGTFIGDFKFFVPQGIAEVRGEGRFEFRLT